MHTQSHSLHRTRIFAVRKLLKRQMGILETLSSEVCDLHGARSSESLVAFIAR
jgi:hypothetical protein